MLRIVQPVPHAKGEGRIALDLLAVGLDEVVYGGQPHVAKKAPWDDGFVWAKTDRGRPWVASAVEDMAGYPEDRKKGGRDCEAARRKNHVTAAGVPRACNPTRTISDNVNYARAAIARANSSAGAGYRRFLPEWIVQSSVRAVSLMSRLAVGEEADHPDDSHSSSGLAVALEQIEIGAAQEMEQAPTWRTAS